ncbi:DUF6221 family protein [Streptomyces sp. NPDC057540]|uniref:DUF6221 family protein n=1 Tax=Streptomyces sp. NPDC057540 TaxID=3346160 RepID=UPI0036890E0B
MDDLIMFLLARLDEDAARAQRCAGDGSWRPDEIAAYGPDLSPEVREHMAAHDPARVLAEVEAKRQMVSEYEKEQRVIEQGHRTAWTEGGQAARRSMIRLWAQVYPGYLGDQDAWQL